MLVPVRGGDVTDSGHSAAMMDSNSSLHHCCSHTRPGPLRVMTVLGTSLTSFSSSEIRSASGRSIRSGADRVRLVTLSGVVGNRDLARFGLLGHRDRQGQYAGDVARVDLVGVEVVSEDQLAAE